MSYAGYKYIIPLGGMGLLTDAPPGDIPRGGLILANNISFERGFLSKAPGSLRYNLTPLTAGIVAIHDWFPDVITQRLIAVTADGSVYRDIGDRTFSSHVPIATGLMNLNTNAFFAEGGNEEQGNPKKLFLFTGTNQVQVLAGDGTTFAPIAMPAVDWTTPNYPNFGIAYRGRLWAFMGQNYYASNSIDHEDFTSLSAILVGTVYPGEGGNVIGGWIFKGRFFLFKQGGFVYYLNDSDADSTNWYWVKFASNFGLSAPHAVGEITNDMIALNESGALISYSAVNTYGGVDSADLYKILQISEYMRENVSRAGVFYTQMMYYEDKKQLFITGRSSYKLHNDLFVVLDMNRQQPRPTLWPKDKPDCIALRKDINLIKRPIYGASDGYVYLMDREDRLVGGAAYTGEFRTSHVDFRDMDISLPSVNKLFDFVAVEFLPKGDWDLSIDVFIDGAFIETLSVPMTIFNEGLGPTGDFDLNSTLTYGREAQTFVQPLHGAGRRISFRCYNSGSNENFEIASLTVYFRLSAEQQTI